MSEDDDGSGGDAKDDGADGIACKSECLAEQASLFGKCSLSSLSSLSRLVEWGGVAPCSGGRSKGAHTAIADSHSSSRGERGQSTCDDHVDEGCT